MDTHTEHSGEANVCRCGHHKMMPVFVIIFGLVFLLADVNVLTWGFVNLIWPILVIIVGIMKLCRCKCCSK